MNQHKLRYNWFLGTDFKPEVEENEVIGRITEAGQFIALSEEPDYATNWPKDKTTKQCFGHMLAVASKHKRPAHSKKTVTTKEFENNETL